MVSRDQMEILVKSQPKSTKEMVKNSICNMKMSDGEQKTVVDPLLEQDDKALFYINYSSLIEHQNKNEKNIHAQMS